MMRKRQRATRVTLVGVWCLIMLGLAGCGGSGGGDTTVRTTRLRLQLVRADQTGNNALRNAVAARQTRAVPTDPSDPAFVARLEVQIEGQGITPPIQQSFPLSASQQTQAIVEIDSIPPGPSRRITVDGFNTAGNRIFTGQTTADLLGEEVTVEIPVQRVLIPTEVTAAALANRAFTFDSGAAFGISGAVTLTFGTFAGETGPFTLVSHSFIASGTMSISTSPPPATAGAAQPRQTSGTGCNFAVSASNYPPGGGPQTGDSLFMSTCEIDTIEGNLVLVSEKGSSTSRPPTAAPEVIPPNTVRIGSPAAPVAVNGVFTVPVEFNAGGAQVLSYLFELTFDHSVVEVLDIQGLGPFSEVITNELAFSTGTVRFAANNVTLTPAVGLLTLANIMFQVVGNSGGTSGLALEFPPTPGGTGVIVDGTFQALEGITFIDGSVQVQ
jgi:hypothetical protein